MQDSKEISFHSPGRSAFTEDYTEVYLWGDNHNGQLGLGKNNQNVKKSYLTPLICSFSLIIKEVSCGAEHAAFLTIKGQIYTMGSNLNGCLGIGNRSIKQSVSPCLVESLQNYNCIQISCGQSHTVALMNYGEVYVWGRGEYGALGTGRRDTEYSPCRISLDDRIPLGAVRISAGGRHSGFISELGGVYLCGSGESGQLGSGLSVREALSPVQVAIPEKINDIACGNCHTLFLTDSGRVYATGNNKFGQLGIGSKKNVALPAHVQSLDAQKIVKIACWNHSACLTEKGELYIWGTGVFGEYLSPVRFSKGGISLKEISVGNFFGAAVENNGRLWVWGGNAGGELGLGDYESRVKPVLNEHLNNKKTVKVSCGGNFMIVLGQIVNHQNRLASPVRVPIKGLSGEQFRTPERRHGEGEWQEYPGTGTGNVVRTSLDDILPIQKIDRNYTEQASLYKDFRSPGKSAPGKIVEERERENVNEENGKEKHPVDFRYVKLLEKQKEVLEKSLKYEREDKQALKKTVEELRGKLENIEKGPEGVNDLTKKLQSQTKNLEEVRETYQGEAKKRVKVTEELYEERNKARKYLDRIREQEETILELRRQLEKYKIEAGEKTRLVDELQQDLEQEKKRNLGLIEDKIAVEDVVFKLREEVQERRASTEKSEHSKLLEEKRQYEREAKSMESKMKIIDESLHQSRRELEREDLMRRQLQEELRKHSQLLDSAQVEVQRLCKENALLKTQIREGPDDSLVKSTEGDKSIEQKKPTKQQTFDYSWDTHRGIQESLWKKENMTKGYISEFKGLSGLGNIDLEERPTESDKYGEEEILPLITQKLSEGNEVKHKRELTFRDEEMKAGAALENLKQVKERLEFLKNSKQTLEGKLVDYNNKVAEINS